MKILENELQAKLDKLIIEGATASKDFEGIKNSNSMMSEKIAKIQSEISATQKSIELSEIDRKESLNCKMN